MPPLRIYQKHEPPTYAELAPDNVTPVRALFETKNVVEFTIEVI